MTESKDISYQSLKHQYIDLGIPTNLINNGSNFTIFNLKTLNPKLPFKLPTSRLNFFVFGFVKEGSGKYQIDNQHFEVKPGTIYFTNPGHYRTTQIDNIEEYYLITFSETFLKENVYANIYEEFPFLLTEIVPSMAVDEELFSEFERHYLNIHFEYCKSTRYQNKIIGGLFVSLLHKFKEHFWADYDALTEGTRASQIVNQFKVTLEKHYRQLADKLVTGPFKLKDYAYAQNLHPNYLNNVIKLKTGKTIGAWIIEKNIAEARSLLQNSNNSVKEIAYYLQFSNPTNFGGYFKKHTGVSPAGYRKQLYKQVSQVPGPNL